MSGLCFILMANIMHLNKYSQTLLNPSTIDGVEKVPEEAEGGCKQS